MNIIEMSLGTESRLYRGNMPGFGCKGDYSDAVTAMKAKNIANIILLCSDKECDNWSRTDLRLNYIRDGFNVIQFPIRDFNVPDKEKLKELVGKTVELLKSKDQNTLVHCVAGNGRTGMVIACIARQVLNLEGDNAISWVRDKIPGAIKEFSQQEMVRYFLEETPKTASAHPLSSSSPSALPLYHSNTSVQQLSSSRKQHKTEQPSSSSNETTSSKTASSAKSKNNCFGFNWFKSKKDLSDSAPN